MTPQISFIDPSRISSKPYTLHAGSILRDRQEPDRRYYSLRYSQKPRRPDQTLRKSKINVPAASEPTLSISDGGYSDQDQKPNDQSNVPRTTHEFRGAKIDYGNDIETFAVIYDRSSESFTLQPLTATYAFNDSREYPQEDAIHNDSDLTATTAKPNGVQGNGKALSTASSLATSPAHSVDGESVMSVTEDVEPDNPFDWRHYIKGIPETKNESITNGSRPLQKVNSTVPSAASTPLSRVGSPLTRPYDALDSASPLPPAASPPRSVPASGINGKVAQSVKRSRKPEPNVLRQATAQKRPRNVSSAGALGTQTSTKDSLRPVTPSIHVETPTPTVTSTPKFGERARPHSHSEPKPPSKSADPNELIIEGEESRHNAFGGRGTPSSYMTPPGGRPMSLREAASRGASPMMHPRPRGSNTQSRLSGGPGFAVGGTTSRQGLGISGVDTTGTETLDFAEQELSGGSKRSDGDVETDLELGSPAYVPQSPKLEHLQDLTPSKSKETATSQNSSGYRPQSPNIEKIRQDEDDPDPDVQDADDGDALERALESALEENNATNTGETDTNVEVAEDQDDEPDLGDALAEALAAEVSGGQDDGEESEEE